MIDTYLQCPNKYKQLYVDGQDEKKDSSALRFGSALHLALQTHFEGGDPYSVFNMYWNSIKDLHLEYDRYSWEDLGEMASQSFLPNFIRLHAKKFSNTKNELKMEAPILGEHTLQGTLDCIAEYEGKLTLFDYKTSHSRYPQYKIMRNPQMYIYAYLYQKTTGVLPDFVCYKVFVKNDRSIQTLKYPLTQQKLDSMMNNVEAIIKDIVDRKVWFCNYNNCFCMTPKKCFPEGDTK